MITWARFPPSGPWQSGSRWGTWRTNRGCRSRLFSRTSWTTSTRWRSRSGSETTPSRKSFRWGTSLTAGPQGWRLQQQLSSSLETFSPSLWSSLFDSNESIECSLFYEPVRKNGCLCYVVVVVTFESQETFNESWKFCLISVFAKIVLPICQNEAKASARAWLRLKALTLFVANDHYKLPLKACLPMPYRATQLGSAF